MATARKAEAGRKNYLSDEAFGLGIKIDAAELDAADDADGGRD